MFSLICVRINDWVHNREACDVRRYRGHYDVIVMNHFVRAVQLPNGMHRHKRQSSHVSQLFWWWWQRLRTVNKIAIPHSADDAHVWRHIIVSTVHWKPRVVIMRDLLSLVAPYVVITATPGASRDGKVVIMTAVNSLRHASVNWPSLVQIMACRLVRAKPLSKPIPEYYILDP